jgi:hypothetical protein
MFRARQPFGWTMTIQGSRERVLDSVLPHEVTHHARREHAELDAVPFDLAQKLCKASKSNVGSLLKACASSRNVAVA